MTDNDTQKPKLYQKQQQLPQIIVDDYFLQMGQANPIQKRQLLSPQSIFPLINLPNFKFGQQPIQQTFSASPSTQYLQLQSHQFTNLFSNPIYTFNNRTIKSSNLQFGCIKVKYAQSKLHKEIVQSQIQSNQNQSQQLRFQSRFQSGNLGFAAKSINPNHYNLLVFRDMNTNKCTQWFFFRVNNKKCGQYFFHILNFIKNYSVFENGMKICVAKRSSDFKWHRGGQNIKYRKTNIPIHNKKNGLGRCYYALTFSYQFDQNDDQIYFAYCYPYTYSMLQKFLFKKINQNPYIKRRNISISPGGNYIDLLTITNFKQNKNKNQKKKRIVFITSRVHPGQTPSSFVCEGIIKYLIGDSQAAKSLRDYFIFKIVPMLNPDGVINGSYRCSLSGYDLNRVWHRADKISHPQIYGTRKAIYQLSQSNLFLFVDLHAHSKKKGVFMYGCQNRANPFVCRHIPFLLSKNINEFNYYQCNFSMRKGRQGTSRLSIFRDLQLGYSYTMQHSFCGPSKQKLHFTVKDFLNIGINFVLTLHKFYSRFKKGNTQQLQVFKQLYGNKQLMKVGDNDNGDSSSDEQLQKENGPSAQLSQDKYEPKKFIKKRQKIFNSVGITQFKKIKPIVKSKYKLSPQKILDIKNSTLIKYSDKNQSKPLPIIGPNFKGQFVQSKEQSESNILIHKSRACFSSLSSTSNDLQQKKFKFRQTYRYSQEQQINSLSNLLLPSLKSASYKKYGKKLPQKRIVHVVRNHIQNALLLKQQIKPLQKRKKQKNGWKQQAKSFL